MGCEWNTLPSLGKYMERVIKNPASWCPRTGESIESDSLDQDDTILSQDEDEQNIHHGYDLNDSDYGQEENEIASFFLQMNREEEDEEKEDMDSNEATTVIDFTSS